MRLGASICYGTMGPIGDRLFKSTHIRGSALRQLPADKTLTPCTMSCSGRQRASRAKNRVCCPTSHNGVHRRCRVLWARRVLHMTSSQCPAEYWFFRIDCHEDRRWSDVFEVRGRQGVCTKFLGASPCPFILPGRLLVLPS